MAAAWRLLVALSRKGHLDMHNRCVRVSSLVLTIPPLPWRPFAVPLVPCASSALDSLSGMASLLTSSRGWSSQAASSPSGEWPSSPVGFEREWPPAEGQGQEVLIAMGGNVGDRVANFRAGLRLLRQAGVVVERHSCLYETEPAYFTEQPRFLNSVVQARTVLPPHDLLQTLKSIEKFVGRDLRPRAVRNGPRPLDLDILFYEAEAVDTEALRIPHARITERPFVLAPLADLLPLPGGRGEGEGEGGRDEHHWSRHRVFGGDLRRFWEEQGGEQRVAKEGMTRVMPVGKLPGNRADGRSGVEMEIALAASLQAQAQAQAIGSQTSLESKAVGERNRAQEPGEDEQCASASVASVAASAGVASEGELFWARIGRGKSTPEGEGPPGRGRADQGSAGGTPHKRRCSLLQVGPVPKPLVMGILNVTPDSFSDGGRHGDTQAAVAHALEMVEDGADIIDVGGQSTRPGARRLTTEEELRRVIPAIEALAANPGMAGVSISVDTFDSVVASAAVAAGAHIVNDVSGGTLDPDMLHTVANLEVPYILMHMRGDPTTMGNHENTTYKHLIADVAAELAARAEAVERAGVPAWQLMLDPGLGFAKTPPQSLQLIQRLQELRQELGRHKAALAHAPLVLGPSRKRFLRMVAPLADDVEDRDWASCAAAAACVANGADVVRMHNVRAGRDAADVAAAVWRGVAERIS